MSNTSISHNYFDIGTDSAANFVIELNKVQPLFKIDHEGRRTLPYQPFFHAYLSHVVSSQTGAGNQATFIPDRILSNIGNHYNPLTGVFKAPIPGVYRFEAHICTENQITSGMINGRLVFVVGSLTYQRDFKNPSNVNSAMTAEGVSFSSVLTVFMEAMEEASVALKIGGRAGETQNSLGFYGANNRPSSTFSGYLLA